MRVDLQTRSFVFFKTDIIFEGRNERMSLEQRFSTGVPRGILVVHFELN